MFLLHHLRLAVVCLLVLPALTACADLAKHGQVTLAVSAEPEQPAGAPVILRMTLANVGKESIGWWCGGPDIYPPAYEFDVQVRYRDEATWQSVETDNGQYVMGSGILRKLQPGESLNVPLGLLVKDAGGVSIRIAPRRWNIDRPAEAFVLVRGDRQLLEAWRAQMIAAILARSPFWTRLAENHADASIIDAMLKLADSEDASKVDAAARVLARQASLPEAAGENLAAAVTRWLNEPAGEKTGTLREHLFPAALNTQSQAGRNVILAVLKNPPDSHVRQIAIDALRCSPGDDAWLRRAQRAIIAAQGASPQDSELAKQAKFASDWINTRITHIEPGH